VAVNASLGSGGRGAIGDPFRLGKQLDWVISGDSSTPMSLEQVMARLDKVLGKNAQYKRKRDAIKYSLQGKSGPAFGVFPKDIKSVVFDAMKAPAGPWVPTPRPYEPKKLPPWHPNYDDSKQFATNYGKKPVDVRRTDPLSTSRYAYRGMQKAVGGTIHGAIDAVSGGSLTRSIPPEDRKRIDEAMGTWVLNLAGVGEDPIESYNNLATLGLGHGFGGLLGESLETITKAIRTRGEPAVRALLKEGRKYSPEQVEKVLSVAKAALSEAGEEAPDRLSGAKRLGRTIKGEGAGYGQILKTLEEEHRSGGFASPEDFRKTVNFIESFKNLSLFDNVKLSFEDDMIHSIDPKTGEISKSWGIYDVTKPLIRISRQVTAPGARAGEIFGTIVHELSHHLELFIGEDEWRTIKQAYHYAKSMASPQERSLQRFDDEFEWWAYTMEDIVLRGGKPPTGIASNASEAVKVDKAIGKFMKKLTDFMEGTLRFLRNNAAVPEAQHDSIDELTKIYNRLRGNGPHTYYGPGGYAGQNHYRFPPRR